MVKPTDPRGYQPPAGEPRSGDRPITDRPLQGVDPEHQGAGAYPGITHQESVGRYEARPERVEDRQRADREEYARTRLEGSRVHHQAAAARISWGALFAGLVTAIVLQILFTTLGMAVGLSTLAVETRGMGEEMGWGAGIWWFVTGLISLFGAGWVAGRVAGIPDREDAAIHGFVTWGLAALFGAFVLTSTVGTLVGGTMGMLNRQLAAATPQAGTPAAENLQRQFQQFLQSQGVAGGTAGLQDQGDVFPPSQQQQQQQQQQAQRQVEQTTERAAEVSAPAMWLTFLALLLGAASCIGGALVGTPKSTTAHAIGT